MKLIEKLQNNNINCKLIKWIAAFLQDRKMTVKVKLDFSDWVTVLSGVPQGSVLGPLLFLIFVNDLPTWIRNSMVLLFADDTKVSCKVLNDSDCSLLQQDLDLLMEWAKYWHLDFNTDKCKVMRIGHRHLTEYTLNGNKLQEADDENDLGITVTNDLKPSVQCAKAAAKAMQVLGIIKSNFVLTDGDFQLLFNGFVHPHLEYCVSCLVALLKKGYGLFGESSV